VQKLPTAEQSIFVDPGVTSHMIERIIKEAIDTKCYEDESNNSTYGFSKACLNVLTRDFADLNPNLTINSCTPGFILTDMTAEIGATNPPEAGTVAPLHCLFGENIGTGFYFGSDAVRSPLDRYRGPGMTNFSDYVTFINISM
jgi:carbonyl reductase 1